MLARLNAHSCLPSAEARAEMTHLLVILPAGMKLPEDCPDRQTLTAILARRGKNLDDLARTPLAAPLESCFVVWCRLDTKKTPFEQFTLLRKATQLLLGEGPAQIDIIADGSPEFRSHALEAAAYVALANGAPLPTLKRKGVPKPLQTLTLWGGEPGTKPAALAEANLLARTLTALPSNLLTPGAYRKRLHQLATELGWDIDEYDSPRLKQLGAGAFLAVASGSTHDDAAIVRLSYRPEGFCDLVAMVGKGICFDTGGHNLKPAKGMAGMHEDMSGSAVALGILLAATRLRLPIRIDAWLALARNELSPSAYRQGDVITALDGSSIEIVHTDAEGRLVLADTLTLAVREQPQLLIGFATLTGSMITALGTRYAGLFASPEALAKLALEAGVASGERLCLFPMDEDYDEELESSIADLKQCTLESDADHILAARFLSHFVDGTPWLHLDLSAASHKGGLGALASTQTGFGVAWGLEFLQRWSAAQAKPAP